MTPSEKFDKEWDALFDQKAKLERREERMFTNLKKAQEKCDHSKYPGISSMFETSCSNCGFSDL
jgi:hypothetical protein